MENLPRIATKTWRGHPELTGGPGKKPKRGELGLPVTRTLNAVRESNEEIKRQTGKHTFSGLAEKNNRKTSLQRLLEHGPEGNQTLWGHERGGGEFASRFQLVRQGGAPLIDQNV